MIRQAGRVAMEFGIFIAWLFLSVVLGIAASGRGRNGIGWGILAMLISPLFAFLLLIALPRLTPIAVQVSQPDTSFQPAGIKTCPRCAETVKAAALVCRFCGHEFEASPAGPSTQTALIYRGVRYEIMPNDKVKALDLDWQIFRNLEEFKRYVDGDDIRQASSKEPPSVP
jgi:hypothetical protein